MNPQTAHELARLNRLAEQLEADAATVRQPEPALFCAVDELAPRRRPRLDPELASMTIVLLLIVAGILLQLFFVARGWL